MIDNYFDVQWQNVYLVHDIFVLPSHENNFQLDDEDVVLEGNFLNVLHQLHHV
jgi:hypothetical protein